LAQAQVDRIQRALTSSGLRPHFILVLASVIVPLALFGVFAWQDRLHVIQSAQGDIDDKADVVGEHMLKSFDSTSLVMRLIEEQIQSMTWADIAGSQSLHSHLLKLVNDAPEVDAIWLIDGDGVLRGSSRMFPLPPTRVFLEPDFLAKARKTEAIVIGRRIEDPDSLYTDQINGSHFHIARKLSGNGIRSDGIIVLSITPSYFENAWNNWDTRASKLMLLANTDLDVLARVPPARNADHLSPKGFIAAGIDSNSTAGSFRTVSGLDGVDRIYSYRRVGPYDAFVAYGKSMSSVLEPWYLHLLIYGGIFGTAAFALAALSLVATQRERRERRAVAQWRSATQDLATEAEKHRIAQKQLFEAEKLEGLGQLTGGFAHDFGNVLMAVQMNLDLLRGRAIGESNEVTLRRIIAEVERGAETLRSLLIFARTGPLDTQIVDLAKAVQEFAPLLHQAIGAHASLEISPARDVWAANINEKQLELALLNIAVNARDAMQDGGLLRIDIRNVSLTGIPDGLTGEFVEISLTDTGSGMPPEVAAKAPEPFFTTKQSEKGTGLGLSQVYGFAKASGGTMSLKSEVGAGTTVSIYIPRHETSADQAGSIDAPESRAFGTSSSGPSSAQKVGYA